MNTTFCLILHGPQQWIHSGNHALPTTLDEIQLYDFEKKSVEMADVLISPSHYALEWAESEGWRLPKETYVNQYVLPKSVEIKYRGSYNDFNEIVFFGRLETRKGLDFFCEALELLPKEFFRGVKVTFLGRSGLLNGSPVDEYFEKRRHRWKFKPNFLRDLNQEEAIQYLASRNCLAVMPSRSETLGFTVMECMRVGVPFLAGDIPAYRELIPDAHQARVLFKLGGETLAEKLIEAFKVGVPKKIPFKVDPVANKRVLSSWHFHHTIRNHKVVAADTNPTVSVCIPHKDRSQFLDQAIESLKLQSYKNLEVIVIDDGSQNKTSLAYLRELEKEFEIRNWKILYMPKSAGPSVARNYGAKVASGEYLLFMDDDNIAKPTEVETFLKVARQTNADIVTCGFDRFYGESPEKISRNIFYRWPVYSDDINQCLFINPIGDTNSLFKKSVFEKLSGFVGDSKTGWEDFNLFIRAVLKGFKVVPCPEALFWYRDHPKNLSKHTDSFRTLESRINTFRDFAGTDLRPIFALMLAWSFRMKMSGDPFEQPPPLVNHARTDVNRPKSEYLASVYHFGAKKIGTYKVAGKASVQSANGIFKIHFGDRKSHVVMRKIKSTSPLLILNLNFISIQDSVIQFRFYKRGSAQQFRVTRKVKFGKNSLSFKISMLNAKKDIEVWAPAAPVVFGIERLEVFEHAK